MAGNIKGITIEFRGDTTRLDKALRQVNNETRSIDKELRAVNKSLKFNPTSVELWKQKQELLTKKVSETRDKLDLLRQAQAKLDDDPAVDKESAEYRELQREIIETESKLKHFEGELKKIGNANLQALGAQFQQVGDKMVGIGKGMTKYVTGPILAIGAASVKAFNEVQNGLNIVAQKTGATGEQLQGMQDIVKDLATNLPTDFESAGTAVGELNTRFGATGKELEYLSEQYIKFSKVNGVDLNQSIDDTQKALSAFGLSAKEAPALLDTLTKAGQMTGASVDTLTQGLIQNGTAFQELGLNIDQAVMLMGQMETSGANSETVMQGLRKALKNAAADGIPLDQALAQLQDTILNGTDGMDGLTAAYDLFGKSGDQIYGAVKNGTLDFTQLAAAAGNTGGTLDKVFNETLTPADKFQMTMNAAKEAGYELGNTVLPLITPLLEKLATNIKAAAEWWGNLSPGMQKAIVIIGGVVASLGPLVIVIGKLFTGIGAIIKIAPMLGTAFTFLTGPVGLVVAAIAAAIAIGVALYKNWDKIKAAASVLLNAIKNVFAKIKTAITGPMAAARDFVKKVVDKIKSFFNFKVKLPHIKLPHFSIRPRGWKLGDLLEGSIPHLGIEWYAKGGIFNSPSVIGVGEKGPEAVLPIEKLQGMMATMADDIVNGMTTGMRLAGTGEQIISIPIYLYPSGPKMGEETVKIYDKYKKILG